MIRLSLYLCKPEVFQIQTASKLGIGFPNVDDLYLFRHREKRADPPNRAVLHFVGQNVENKYQL